MGFSGFLGFSGLLGFSRFFGFWGFLQFSGFFVLIYFECPKFDFSRARDPLNKFSEKHFPPKLFLSSLLCEFAIVRLSKWVDGVH